MLRRRGDVWLQLPPEVRAARAVRTVAGAVVIGGAIPVAAALALGGRPQAAAAALATTIAVIGAVVAATSSAARRALGAKGVPERLVRKWLHEATWGMSFWRRPEVSAHLAEADAPKKSAIDSAAEDPILYHYTDTG